MEAIVFDVNVLAEESVRYLSFYVTVKEEHSMAFEWRVYTDKTAEKPDFTLRFGVLGNIRTHVCIDLSWLSAATLFPEPAAGSLKFVCHGGRVDRQEIRRAELVALPCYHEAEVEVSKPHFDAVRPKEDALPEGKLVDCFGQNCRKEWPGKIHTEQELCERLEAVSRRSQETAGTVETAGIIAKTGTAAAAGAYPFADWSRFGGWRKKKLTEGSGYFSRKKENGRWWLTDPEGYAFFSVGPDCVGANIDCRIDGVEKWLEWLPAEDDPDYGVCFRKGRKGGSGRRVYRSFDYLKANLIRAYGKQWKEKWQQLIAAQLKGFGMNTIGNWSDGDILGTCGIPYVTSLPEFPATKVSIFRDFPDVFSEEYSREAKRCAEALEKRKNDPFMIGYFLRNEPSWAFVDNLILADEALYNPAPSCCKNRLIAELREKYVTVDALNRAWNSSFSSFEELHQPQKKLSSRSSQATEDLRAFSRSMVRAYIEIPSAACRKVDANHMILGMRWAWISDPDLVTGWENFDVFSINCYAVDPTKAIQNIADHQVDLPVMIGEFHFGALDRGLTATGLEGVASQKDRGLAYRYYCERVAAHPYGVGCHYFQCYDQFLLGRFDGENYNIGLFDICLQPYTEMLDYVKECSRILYETAAGTKEPTEEKGSSIPMIAF